MSVVFRYFRNLMRIICVFAYAFCVFIGSAISSNYLPSGYTELEYIESNELPRDAYIDTELNFNSNYIYEFSFAKGGTDNSILGCRKKSLYSEYGNFSVTYYSGDTGVYSSTSSGSTCANFGDTAFGVKHTIKYQQSTSTLLFDGTDYWRSDWINSVDIPYSVYLFAFNIAGSPAGAGARAAYVRIYSYSVKNSNNVLIQNLIPARRNSDYVVGMYDTVSNTFFTNAGTGEFIAGPVLEIEIATTKYVETAFADSVSELNTTMGTIKNVVDNTIIQADRIGKLHTGKQTRPAGSCPEGRMCLLITESDGTLRWYPICGADGSVEPFDSNAWLTAFTNAGKPNAKGVQDSNGKWTYYNGFFKGMGSWRQQYADASTLTYDRPFAHATRCNNPNYTTYARDASPCYTEVGMYKTLTDGEWAVVYEGNEKGTNASTSVDPGVIYGISKCVSTNLTGSVSYATKATAAQLADTLFDATPANTTDAANYKQCWCKMTAIGLPGGGATAADKATNGGIASLSGATWVYDGLDASGATCASYCAYYCTYHVQLNTSFRSAIVSTNN